MHDRKRQRASRQSNKPNRDDFAEILNEIRFAHEQAGRLPNTTSGISPRWRLVMLLSWARAQVRRTR
jgi:hypothetical protein